MWFYNFRRWPAKDIDHINGIKFDNRLSNLRESTEIENLRNHKILSDANKSGVCGVIFCKQNKKWQAYIGINNKQKHLGFFTNKVDAVKAREKAEIKYNFTLGYIKT